LISRYLHRYIIAVFTISTLLIVSLLAGCQISIPQGSSTQGNNDASGASWTIEPTAVSIAPGGKLTLKAFDVGKDGSKIADPQGFLFQTANSTIATVAANGTIWAAPEARTGSSVSIKVIHNGVSKDIRLTIKYALEDTITVPASGKDKTPIVTNPEDVAVVVNKNRSLPTGYAPPSNDLREPNVPFSFKEKSEKKLMRTEAALALERLFDQAARDQIKLAGVSAYRSYVTQQSIFSGNMKTQGEKEASQYSARPGLSEHQTALAIDVSSPSVKYALEESFGNTPEGKWLVNNAPTFGFIIRYMKGKEAITGYSYEPWHIRYVGVEMAKEISERGITLEEYFEDAVPVSKQTAAQ
jgi:D-alanyl-D-alanine carboxypeptidase